jgi:hypothetical protein
MEPDGLRFFLYFFHLAEVFSFSVGVLGRQGDEWRKGTDSRVQIALGKHFLLFLFLRNCLFL